MPLNNDSCSTSIADKIEENGIRKVDVKIAGLAINPRGDYLGLGNLQGENKKYSGKGKVIPLVGVDVVYLEMKEELTPLKGIVEIQKVKRLASNYIDIKYDLVNRFVSEIH